MFQIRRSPVAVVFALVLLAMVASVLTGCMEAQWNRRDMPTAGLNRLVTYDLNGPAGTANEKNTARLRGVNAMAPTLQQETIFGKMSGTKTQDVQVTLPDGRVYQALGMTKTQRFAGLTAYLSAESATYSGIDSRGNAVCGAKIRVQFNRNFTQYQDPEKRDWDSLWYYDVPCVKTGTQFAMNISRATLRALVLTQVWQARIAAGSFFFNWGRSVTVVGGLPASFPGGWWEYWDTPGSESDT